MKECSPPQGLFRNKNFMTPNILAYYKLAAGYAELSEGRGIYEEPIFGVTVRPDPNPRRSQLFHSKPEALRYIESMS